MTTVAIKNSLKIIEKKNQLAIIMLFYFLLVMCSYQVLLLYPYI